MACDCKAIVAKLEEMREVVGSSLWHTGGIDALVKKALVNGGVKTTVAVDLEKPDRKKAKKGKK